ncbi:ATP-binding protein [uncultured Sunxiuqinia sp.]|uniref:ATP-binding protein n=1 Tax=uncultured Sunxiuqinia sp. TaxID=1573825 RepID=UPI002AA7C2FB|nr:ATP-binding protein [uncultured Sunxiuqinia sp.]
MTEIAILSGKGGTGKSSLSAALASLTSKIVVADCDVDAANLHLVLQPNDYREEVYISGQKAVIDYQKCTDCGQCLEYCRFDAIHYQNNRYQISGTACDGCKLCAHVCPSEAISMVNHDESRWYVGDIPNGKMVHARLAPGEDNSGKLVNIVRDEAREVAFDIKSDIILIDGPPGIGCPVISSLSGIDKVVLVTEPTQSGIHDLKRIVELVRHYKLQTYVVINKFDLNQSLSEELKTWCHTLQIPVIGELPFDELVVDAMVHCESITNWAPDSCITNEIKKIWNKLIRYEPTESF